MDTQDSIEVYLEEGVLSEEGCNTGLRIRTLAGEIQPMLCGTAFKNKGVQRMLDAILDYMPSPVDIPPVQGLDEEGEVISRKANDKEPMSALAFKLMTDPFVGQLTFVRVYSGVLRSGDTVYNSVKHKRERIGRILKIIANNLVELKEQFAVDFSAL